MSIPCNNCGVKYSDHNNLKKLLKKAKEILMDCYCSKLVIAGVQHECDVCLIKKEVKVLDDNY